MAYAKLLLDPPPKLEALPGRWAKGLRAAWILFFGLAVLTVAASTAYAVRASFWVQPIIHQFGLDFDVTTEGKLLVGTPPGRQPAIPVAGKVIAIDGKPAPPDLHIAGFAERLDGAPGPQVLVTLQQPDGRMHALTLSRNKAASPAEEKQRSLRIWARLFTGLLACISMLACSLLLALRRPDDPVAMLLSLAFVGLAATIDPPLQFWLWTGHGGTLDML